MKPALVLARVFTLTIPFASIVALFTIFGPVTFAERPRATPNPKLFFSWSEAVPVVAPAAPADTVSVTDALCVLAPAVPVTVTVLCAGAEVVGFTVSTDFVLPAAVFAVGGVNTHDAPDGQVFPKLSTTCWLKPGSGVTVMLDVAVPPALTGEGLSLEMSILKP